MCKPEYFVPFPMSMLNHACKPAQPKPLAPLPPRNLSLPPSPLFSDHPLQTISNLDSLCLIFVSLELEFLGWWTHCPGVKRKGNHKEMEQGATIHWDSWNCNIYLAKLPRHWKRKWLRLLLHVHCKIELRVSAHTTSDTSAWAVQSKPSGRPISGCCLGSSSWLPPIFHYVAYQLPQELLMFPGERKVTSCCSWNSENLHTEYAERGQHTYQLRHQNNSWHAKFRSLLKRKRAK